MDVTYLLFLVSFIFLDTIRGSLAVLCTFHTSHGILQQKYCKERCCEGPNVRYSTVCCYKLPLLQYSLSTTTCFRRQDSVCCKEGVAQESYKRDSEIYIGTGMATLIVLTIFLLCFTYICCRRKLLRQARDSNARNRNTRLHTRRNHVLPTVSERVQPPVPPPYELLPPPYYPFDQSKNFKNENTPSLPTSPTLPDGPPPAYSPYDTVT